MRKLKFFLNLLIFIALFALISASSTLYFENKIDEIDSKIILEETNEIVFNNQIENIPSIIEFIKNIINQDIVNQINLEVTSFLQKNNKISDFYDEREEFYLPFYTLKNSSDIVIYISNQVITDALLISNDNTDLEKVKKYKKILSEIKIGFEKLDLEYDKIQSEWEIAERKELNQDSDYDNLNRSKEEFYKKFSNLKNDASNLLVKQIDFLTKINNNYFIYKKNKSNKNILNLQKKIEEYSFYETRLILVAFIIQILLFICIQYFEFSVNSKEENEKK